MKKIKTLVLLKLTDEEKNIFTQFNDTLDFSFKDMEKVKVTQEDVEEAEFIIGYPPRKYLRGAKQLKWLQLISSGVDKYLKDNILPQETILTNARGSYGESQSEFMFATLIALMKKIHLYRDNQRESIWHDEGNVMMLKGSVALVIGLGDIGSRFAALLKAFGVYVIGVRRDPSKGCESVDEVHSFTQLDSLVEKADIVAMVIPSTPETEKLMSAQLIAKMKKGSVLVNTGRGATVDNEALCDAVERGDLAGAALDVFDVEPIPSDHRIWKMKDIIVTPHIAGLEYMEPNWQKLLTLIEENLKAYCEGKSLRNLIDRDRYEFT